MLSVSLPVGGTGGPFGWPILPHGGGSSYNNYGWYMGSNSAGAFSSVGINYGEYMPQAGRIYGAAVNWAIKGSTNLIRYKIYAVNYGSLAAFLPIFPGMDITASGAIPAAVGGGVIVRSRGSNSVWEKRAFKAGDYIGIYIVPEGGHNTSGSQMKDAIEIEGTIYLRFDNVEEGPTATDESKW
jgi:hypothetical protein